MGYLGIKSYIVDAGMLDRDAILIYRFFLKKFNFLKKNNFNAVLSGTANKLDIKIISIKSPYQRHLGESIFSIKNAKKFKLALKSKLITLSPIYQAKVWMLLLALYIFFENHKKIRSLFKNKTY